MPSSPDASAGAVLVPTDTRSLSESLRELSRRNGKVGRVDLGALAQVVEYHPEDMTATVQTGMLLADLQGALAQRGQWLPLDPAFPESITLHELIAHDRSGPRRLGYGTVRDHLLGVQAVVADGTIIRSGGKVVKNVAGYDLLKLFVGAQGSLGIVTEATFKLRPLPESECFLRAECASLEAAEATGESALRSDLAPVSFDLHASKDGVPGRFGLTIGFAGSSEEAQSQRLKAAELGFKEKGDRSYEEEFWEGRGKETRRLSVLPSTVFSALRELKPPFLARLGNGIVYHVPAGGQPSAPGLTPLMRRVKQVFDPQNTFPDYCP